MDNEETKIEQTATIHPEPNQSDAEREAAERTERARKLNESARLVTASDFLADYLPPLPPVSKEFVAESRPIVLDDSNPYRVVVGQSGVDAGSGAAADVPTDSKRVRFDPSKHLLGDDGKPLFTASGRFRSIPKAGRAETIDRQRAQWAGVQSGADDGAQRGEPVDPDDAEKEASLWVDFCETCAAMLFGENAKMQELPNGAKEKELIARGIAAGFTKWKMLRFPAALSIVIAGWAWVRRIKRESGGINMPNWAKRKPEPKPAEGQEIVVSEPNTGRSKPNAYAGTNARDIFNQL